MRWSLQRKLFVTVGAGAAVLALVMSLLLDLTVVGEVQRHEDRALAQTKAAFEALERHRRGLLLERARLVSELPYFKAAISVYDPDLPPERRDEALATVADVARRILERVDVDLLTLTAGDGTPLFAVGPAAERGPYDPEPVGALARHALRHMASDGIVPAGRDLVHVASVQVDVGGFRAGALCLGTSLDVELANALEDMTGSAVVLMGRDQVYARSRSVPLALDEVLRRRFASAGGPERREILEAEGTRWRTLWLPFEGPGDEAPGAFVVLRSEGEALAFLSAVREGLLVIASAALVLALAFSYLFARHLTVPLRALVAFTERMSAGDLAARAEIRTRDELALLGDSFNRMAETLSGSRIELEKSNRVLAEANAQLLQAGKMAAIGELGAGLTHDLKQPLAAIRGFAQLAERRLRPEDADTRRHLGLIIQSVDHMNHIVQGLRDFSRASSFTFRPVDVNEVVERTCLLLQGQLRSARVTLVKDLAPDLPPILGEPNQLQQVVTNLLANARDALEAKGGTVHLETRSADGGNTVRIAVTDDGPGIPPENLSRIFSSFFTTKPEGKGTGLGLSITQGIVRDHGGRLEVTSVPHRATTFLVLLPTQASASRTPAEAPRAA